MTHTTEVQAAGPDPVVVRRATGPDAARLRSTGERLLAAAHPGVVEVVGSTGTEHEWELRLVYGGRPIDLVGPLSVEEVASAAAAVAATLADLHDAGIVHGRLDASHVLIGAHGRPVLCGFADSGSVVGAHATRPEDDVAALGALIVSLLGTEAELEPIPGRRWRRYSSWMGWARRALLLVADQACADPPTRRPSARRLAAAIADAVPAAPAVDDTTAGHPPRLRALACAVLGVVLLAAGSLRLVRPATRSAPDTAASSPSAARPTSSPPATFPPTTTTHDRPPAPCPITPPAPAGCVEPVTIEGTTVLVGARRYEVGEPGDRILVGDWDCDGGATPAVLRPSTGEVFVFATWAADEDVVVRAVARAPGGTQLVSLDGEDGCPALAVRHADGSQETITAARTA